MLTASQRAMHGFAEQRRVVVTVVEAHHIETVDIGAFEVQPGPDPIFASGFDP